MSDMRSEHAKLRFLLERGRYPEAEALLRNELAKEPDDAALHLHLARVLNHLERPKEAEAAARSAIGLNPESGFPYEVLAEVLISSANWKGVEEAVARANALDGDDPDRRAILARTSSERRRYQACLEHAEAGLEMDPDHDACRFFRGVALGRLGRHDEADEASLGLLGDDPEDSSNHTARAWILMERNADEEAKRHFQEALRIDPDNEDARSGLAVCLQRRNPLLGWLLRAILAVERVPFTKLLVGMVLVGIVLPTFLKSEGRPDSLKIAGTILRSVVFSFFYVTVAAKPLFDAVLFASRQGRDALGRYESRAVRWSVLPLLAGLFYLADWVAGGSKSLPVPAIGLLCASTLLHEAICNRHPWVRRRLMVVAGVACGFALWFVLGREWLLRPRIEQIGSVKTADELVSRLKEMIQLMNRAFVYPALVIYMVTAYSDHLTSALIRRAPDEVD
jgi:tetratricopeptide (TPR) repeat protein